jgi:hypothetical protein
MNPSAQKLHRPLCPHLMDIHPSSTRHLGARLCVLAALLLLLAAPAAPAQLSPNALKGVVGNRIEAATILGGDFGMTGATYTRGSKHDLTMSKFGGSGDVGDPMPLGGLPIGWQPRLQGSMGYLDAKNTFTSGPLDGDTSKYHSFSIEFGGGARFWFNDQLSIAPTFMGMYGHTENDYTARSAFWSTNSFKDAQKAGAVDWTVDTWTLRPAMNIQYLYTWHRTIFTLSSDFVYFHTQSFSSSSSLINIDGDSETWQNKIDIDIPLGKELFGHELRTGGYFSRMELYDGIKNGLGTDHLYEAHGRVVLDFLGELWKVQWIGLGGSYLWGNNNASGFSVGADICFRF